jgi:hypothetical protein
MNVAIDFMGVASPLGAHRETNRGARASERND